MTIATANNGNPAAAAVFYVPINEGRRLLFVSSEKSEHITNLKNNINCAVTIQEDGQDWNIIRGIQIKGEIRESDDKNWEKYFDKYDYINNDETLSKALAKVKLYELRIKWLRMIDNSKGFGNREEYLL